MSLHEYASDLLGSKAGMRVLRVLLAYPGKIFTMREVARTAKVSHPEASKILRRLEGRGMVRLQAVGRAQQVTVNSQSYYLKSLAIPLFQAERETVRALAAKVASYFEQDAIESVAIFGSVARGAEGTASDVDILIVTRDRELAVECASRANEAVVEEFGVSLSPLIVDAKEFAEGRDTALERSILGSYILVRGRDLKAPRSDVETRR